MGWLHEEFNAAVRKTTTRLLEQDPNDAELWRLLGDWNGGEVHGRHYSQLDCYKKSLELNDKDSETWCELASSPSVQLKSRCPVTINGKVYTALQLSEHAVEVNPKSSNAWTVLCLYHGGVVNGKHYSRSQTAWKALFAPQHRIAVYKISLYYLFKGVGAVLLIASIIHVCFFAAIRPVSKRKKKKMMYQPTRRNEKDEI